MLTEEIPGQARGISEPQIIDIDMNPGPWNPSVSHLLEDNMLVHVAKDTDPKSISFNFHEMDLDHKKK